MFLFSSVFCMAMSDAEKEKISEEIIDAMLEPEVKPAADSAEQKSTDNTDDKSTENADEKSTEIADEKSTENADDKSTENPDDKSTEIAGEESTENAEKKSTENQPVADTADISTEKLSTETEMVTEELGSAAETQADSVAKQQSVTTTDESVAVVTPVVDEKGDAGESDMSDRQTVTATETGAGDAKFPTGR